LGIYVVRGQHIRRLVREFDRRLFARNIRGHLGESNAVNAGIARSISEQPERFLYLNNGVTIVCDESTFQDRPEPHLIIRNPQIVNGQQTSYGLVNAPPRKAENVLVMTRVITIQRDDEARSRYHKLVSDVVQATNTQSAVTPGDLRSNERNQVELTRQFARLRHYYARKKQPKRQQEAAANGLPFITREELAEAVGSCLVESLPHRESKDQLYLNDTTYRAIFDSTEARRDLAAVYLWRAISAAFSGRQRSPERKQAKWLAMYWAWKKVGPTILTNLEGFIAAQQRRGQRAVVRDYLSALGEALEAFYRYERDHRGYTREAANFFKQPSLEPRFNSYLRSQFGTANRTALTAQSTRLKRWLRNEART
jgi:hypothetical protein